MSAMRRPKASLSNWLHQLASLYERLFKDDNHLLIKHKLTEVISQTTCMMTKRH